MKKIAALGPKETFCDYAAQKYLKKHPEISATISYHKTIRTVFEELAAKNCDIGVVPVENTLAGFVWTSLDGLQDFGVQISEELILQVRLSFLSKIERDRVENIFLHPMAEGQCSQFLYKNFPEAKITYTNSNIDSFNRVNENDFSAAVVPKHIYDIHASDYPFSVEGICDAPNNCTRFLVLQNETDEFSPESDKTSVIISDDSDSPGILKNIAAAFAKREINMISIISRPTRRVIGKYHFFIDFDGSVKSAAASQALGEISKKYPVKILGSYKSAK